MDGAFEKWLRCYQNPDMKCLIDKNKRTIWFDGEPGSLVPKGISELFSRITVKLNRCVCKEVLVVTIKLYFCFICIFIIECKSRQPRKKRQIVTEEASEVSIKIETITKVPKLETKESAKVLTTRSTRRSPRFSAKL